MFPVIREVMTIDDMVKGAVRKFEIVEADNYDMPDYISSHWTEREAVREMLALHD